MSLKILLNKRKEWREGAGKEWGTKEKGKEREEEEGCWSYHRYISNSPGVSSETAATQAYCSQDVEATKVPVKQGLDKHN